ncbi:MAG: hypothetical protein HOY78_25760 [Saccharothrix sp.]|nr:hypothetical protein [Saccharothrix sp.]
MSWESVERVSWLAGILSALVAIIAAWMAARAAKGTTRDLALIVAAATDKPELLAALEENARKRAEQVRRRLRAVVAAAATAFVLVAVGGLLGVLLSLVPDHVEADVVGGDRPRTVRECASGGGVALCQDVHVYDMSAGAKVETRFAVTGRPSSQHGSGGLSVELPGCEAEVRWHVEVDGRVLADAVSRDDLVRVEFPAWGSQEYVFSAQRPTGGDCATAEVRVRTGISFER